MMTDTMKQIFGMNVLEPGLKILRRPGEGGFKQCQELGRKIAEKVKMGGAVM